MIGKQLSHYRIVEELGEGGMSQVFLAEDLQLHRRVALKVLPADLASDAERLARFDREATILAGLHHPNIVTIYSVEQDQGLHFLTMELVEGKTLAELIAEGELSRDECRGIAIAVADALAAAHDKGVVHRDLKPSNIVVDDTGWVKVLDFGLAKMAPWSGASADAPTLAQTREGLILGTVPYMSPEQVEGTAVDFRSDFFSLGITLYEMTTGSHPFPGDSAARVMSAILRDRKHPLDQLRVDLPTAWERIISRCMEKDPARRYQSAAELKQDLLEIPDEVGRASSIRRRLHRLVGGRRRRGVLLSAVVLLALVGGLVWLMSRSKEGRTAGSVAEPERTMMVVLPFENLGPAENDYFVAGLTEEITSRLGVARSIGLISRQSALQYADTTKSAKQIGEELGVDYILDGTVRWSPGEGRSPRVRITPQLIRAADDSGLWVQTYDRVVDDIFQLQSEIAEQVFAQLGVTLGTPERQTLEARPTDNLEAYQVYLRGRYLKRIPDYSAAHRESVIERFQESVALDPNFTGGWVELSLAHSFLYHLGLDISEARRALARSAVDRAAALAPQAPETHVALGFYHYWVEQDYERALSEFEMAAAELPSDAEVLEAKALVYRRQGRWQEAMEHFRRALTLNPRDGSLLGEVGETQVNLRRFAEGIRSFDLAISLSPEVPWLYIGKAGTYWMWKGTTEEARAVLDALPPTDESHAVWSLFWQEIFEGRYRAALERLEEFPGEWLSFSESHSPKSLLAGHALRLLGEPERARAAYDEARRLLQREVEEWPDDPRRHSALGIALAALGRKEEAIREGRRAVDLHPMSRDAFSGAYYLSELAFIYTLAGDYELAIDLLEELLNVPSLMTAPILRLDPRWDSLESLPRYQQILEEHLETQLLQRPDEQHLAGGA